jgi:uroporphyrinogen-III decarboxylase
VVSNLKLKNRSEQTIEEAALHCLTVGGSRSFSAAGCEIPDGTPPKNLRIHARVLREAGSSFIVK